MENDNFYNSEFIEVDGNRVHKTAIINNNVKMGKGNVIGAYTVIGSNGEVRGVAQDQFLGTVEIGDDNLISELVTIQTPKEYGEITRIGDRCLITAHSHIGHNVHIGNDVEICISIIGGYATVKDHARIKMGSIIRNRKTVGAYAVVGMCSAVVKDVPDRVTVCGVPAKILKK